MSVRIPVHLTPDELIVLGNVLLTVLEQKVEVPGTEERSIAGLAAHIQRSIEKIVERETK